HVRAREEQAAEGDAPPLAARDLRHVHVAGRHPERVNRELDGTIEVPGVRGVDLVLQARLLLEQLLHLVGLDGLTELRADLLEPGGGRAGRGAASPEVAAAVLRGIELGLLRQMADPEAGGGNRLAQKIAVDARHDAEQRGLAGAVGAEHADLRPVEEREPDAPEDLPFGRDDLPEILHHERVFAGHGIRLPPHSLCAAAGGAPAPRRPAGHTTRQSARAPCASSRRCSGIMQRSWTTRIPARASFSAAPSCRMPSWNQTVLGRHGRARISSAWPGRYSGRRKTSITSTGSARARSEATV